MTEPSVKLEQALAKLSAVPWDTERAARLFDGARNAAQAKPARPAFYWLGGAVAMAALATLWLARPELPGGLSSRTAPSATTPLPGVVSFGDGSRAVPLQQGMTLERTQTTQRLRQVRLTHGGARFEIAPSPTRRFVVSAADVDVEVKGTIFTVEHVQGRIQVGVIEGQVEVAYAGERTLLGPGSHGLFPPLAMLGAGGSSAPSATAPAGSALTDSAVPEPSWQALAQGGNYKSAYAKLKTSGKVRDLPEELLLAADVARNAGFPSQAAAHLERLLARYPSDPRAAVAGFSLGRVQGELGNKLASARAFEASATRGGQLAEDALYRAVEAYRAAGQSTRAAELSRRYLAAYPRGRYVALLLSK